MDENIYPIAEQIVQLLQKVHEIYLPLVENVCNRIASEDELLRTFVRLFNGFCT